jgi:N-methylhydantoinase A
VTDADVVLGYLPVEGFADGRMTLDVDAARAAIDEHVAQPLGLDVVDAAWGIERIVNANMANATRKVLAGYGADARELAMIAYGGNGPVHAWAIAAELGIGRVLVPKTAPAFSALGVLVADYVVDLMRSYVVPLSQVDVERLRALMQDVADEAGKELAPAGIGEHAVTTQLFVQMAYPGQNFDMSVPAPEGTDLAPASLIDLAERFHDQHEAERGFAFRQHQPIVRGVRLTARGITSKPDHMGEAGAVTDAAEAETSRRPVHFGSGFVETPVYDGSQLGIGASVDGPALIEEPFTVVVVPPGTHCRLAEHLSYELRPIG